MKQAAATIQTRTLKLFIIDYSATWMTSKAESHRLTGMVKTAGDRLIETFQWHYTNLPNSSLAGAKNNPVERQRTMTGISTMSHRKTLNNYMCNLDDVLSFTEIQITYFHVYCTTPTIQAANRASLLSVYTV